MLFGSISRPLMYVLRAMRGRPNRASKAASPRMERIWAESAFKAFLYRSLAVLVCCCWACSIKKYIQMCHHPRRTCTMHQASLIEIEEYRVLPEGEY